LKNNQTSKILPLLSFHDAELTKPIIDDTIDVGEYDVNVGTKKKIYVANPNKELTALVVSRGGPTITIPPQEAAEWRFEINPFPEPETWKEHRAFMTAMKLNEKEPMQTLSANITWIKAEK